MDLTVFDPTVFVPALILGPYWAPYLPLMALSSLYFMVPIF